jgi:hypothetical protein
MKTAAGRVCSGSRIQALMPRPRQNQKGQRCRQQHEDVVMDRQTPRIHEHRLFASLLWQAAC